MSDALGSAYPFLKWLHIVAVISWMAGLFYLPRLFMYHAASTKGSEKSETFKVMEQRLYRIIMTPAMLVAWAAGLLLIFTPQIGGLEAGGWLWIKLLFVLGMTAFHGSCGRWLKRFATDKNTQEERYFRIVNEVPTVLMLVIVALVIWKPL